MKHSILSRVFISCLAIGLVLALTPGRPAAAGEKISGEIIGGYRVIPVSPADRVLPLTVYRGDYVKFKPDPLSSALKLSIPELSIETVIPADSDTAPYFKMKTTGRFAFTLGEANGEITVIEYRQPDYREVPVEEAATLIKNISPLVLDVRTPGEYARGHLHGALLIPVQELQRRMDEIGQYKHDTILVFCASGNRSTVAAKILIDGGFKRIYNLRDGFHRWESLGYPVER